MPAPIAEVVAEWKSQYRKAFLRYNDDGRIFVEEDAKYTVFNADCTKRADARGAGEFAGFEGMQPGSSFNLPVGCVVIATGFFCGMPWMKLTTNGGLKLAA